jgi:type I restriction enzyme, S subunit
MNWPQYREYANSAIEWLGDLPSGWTVSPLKYAAKVFPSSVDKHTHEGEIPVRLCNYTDVYYNDRISAELDFMEATATEGEIRKFTLRRGDTIITKDSETADDIGLSAYVAESLNGVLCGYHLSVVRPSERLVGRFAKRLFDTSYLKAVMEVSANGLTRVGLGQYAIDNLDIPLPPVDEQIHIADFLDRETDKIDALIAKQEQLIATLREDRTATITHAVTKGLDAETAMSASHFHGLPTCPTGWIVTPLKHVCVVRDCKHLTAEFVDDGYPLASIREVQSRYVDLVNEKGTTETYYRQLGEGGRSPQAGDLIFSRNATVGEVAQVPPQSVPFAMGQDVCLLRPETSKLDPNYAWYVLRSRLVGTQIELMMIGSTFKRINVEEIKSLVVTCPSLTEQREIVEFLDDRCGSIDALVAKAQHVIEVLIEYRSALITDAVTGKIDVRGAA